MTKTITFNDLRRLKDSLPEGATHRIADNLHITCLLYTSPSPRDTR